MHQPGIRRISSTAVALAAPARAICLVSPPTASPCPRCSQQYGAVTGLSRAVPLAREVQVKHCCGKPVPFCSPQPARRRAPCPLPAFTSSSQAAVERSISTCLATFGFVTSGKQKYPSLAGVTSAEAQGKLKRKTKTLSSSFFVA